MKISLGNFGDSVADIAPAPSSSPVNQAAIGAVTEVQRTMQHVQENREALQRAKAANSLATYQLAVEETGRTLEEDIASGTVNYEKANEEYATRTSKIQATPVSLDNPIDQENHSAGLKYVQERGRLALAPQVYAARQRDGETQFDTFLDTQAKRAIEPGADVGSINATADGFAANARAYGIPENVIAGKVQAFKDSNWFNNAAQRAVEAHDDIQGLRTLLNDVTSEDGPYAGKLDPTKRAALQAGIQNRIDSIEMRGQALSDRREAKAERAVAQIDRQISSGVPLTPEMWADAARVVDGTAAKADFDSLAGNEREIQQVLRAPIAEQVRLVQERKAAIDKGGTLAQAANVDRLARAVDANVKLLTQAPVLFGEQRLGDEAEPLNITNIFSPDAQQQNSATLQERAARIRAMSKQFGTQVPMRPLLPQEAKSLADVMQAGSPTQVADLFNTLRDSAGSPDVYRGIMSQVAPDQPVKAAAGILSSMQRELTTASHWFKPDESITSRDTASLMLEGDRLLNRSSTAKAEDGKPQNQIFLTEAANQGLQDEFGKAVGNNFRNDPQGAEVALQNVRAYYVGKVARTGAVARDSQAVNTGLVREAVKATLGNIVDFHGQGNVQAPWGMSQHDFEDRVTRALTARGAALGLSPEQVDSNLWAFGLDDGPEDGVYVVTSGGSWQRDAANRPILLDIRPPDQRGARGFIDRGGK